MIDNFQLLEPLLEFTNPGDCYFIQLLKRKKDNLEMTRNMVNVDNFFVYSLEEYREMKTRIIELSNLHNARAYIRVNRRNTERMALQTLVTVSYLILNKDYKAVKNAYLSAAGNNSSEPIKRWIVDIDCPPSLIARERSLRIYADEITKEINKLHDECNRNSKQGVYKILMEIPTKNGIHLITNPFNLQKFREFYSDIDIHKDNPTILYTP